jgi:hypothetical protein
MHCLRLGRLLNNKFGLSMGKLSKARLECLKDLLDRRQKELADWLGEVDQIDCCAYIQEYQCLHGEVCGLSEKISLLTGAAPPTDQPLPADSLENTIMVRIRCLRAEEKI